MNTHNTDWQGLYGESWTGIITSESFAHPAKFSRGLIRHIYQHLFDEGWLQPGDTVLDPFGGVALGAWPALQMGIHWIGKELEQPFCDLGQGCDCTGISKADWVRFFGRWDRARYLDGRHWCPECLANAKVVVERNGQLSMFDAPLSTSYVRNSGRIPHTEPHRYHGNIERWADFARNGASAVLLQGDSRYLLDVVGEAGAVISSPPYASGTVHDDNSARARNQRKDAPKNRWGQMRDGSMTQGAYSTNPANLGNMPAGDPGDGRGVDAVIGSPPYAGSINQGNAANDGQARIERKREAGIDVGRAVNVGGPNSVLNRDQCYGSHPGQLAAMPPGPEPGQVADGLVSSPPYEGSAIRNDLDCSTEKLAEAKRAGITVQRATWGNNKGSNGQLMYGDSLGQLGGESGPTFWSAARVIVQQCYHILKPGAVAVWVVKRFVRDKQIVEFSQQWADLCQSCGFELLHWHRAMLVEDGGTQLGLMGEDKRKVKKRYSFFRRLHAQKYPHLEIQWEDILCMRKV